jgi:ribosomal protein L11 methyltransferase
VVAATANASLNGVKRQCTFSASRVHRTRGVHDVVVANIDARTLEALAPVLVARLDRGGVLFVTGLLEEDAPQIARVYGEQGVEVVRREREAGWILLALRKAKGGAMPRVSPSSRARRGRAETVRKKTRTPRSR